jgi:ABC-type antimicrobial peptide transport system permease subunit
LYVPLQQRYASRVTLFVRTGAERTLAADLQNLVRGADPNLLVLGAARLDLGGAGPVETQLRVASIVSAGIGAVGLILAAMGVYGVTAYAVARRTREIGIRLTLGATGTDVVRLVMRQGMGLVALGSVIGLVLGFGVSRALSASPFRALPAEPSLFVGVALLLGLVGLVACYAPVRRAVRTRPVEALRHE